mmetsp:Transcript_41292/g.98877  ORF Transcript_41292/g.98877 Transcript_41292/m.98877 type:complete len:287 (-) Transcript_41292:1880-2740(-)
MLVGLCKSIAHVFGKIMTMMKIMDRNRRKSWTRRTATSWLNYYLVIIIIVSVTVNVGTTTTAAATADRIRSNPRYAGPVVVVPAAFTQPELWAVRVSSAVLTYGSFVAYSDRPRGMLSPDVLPSLQIAASQVPGAGLGLFCTSTIRRGTVLGTYPGVVTPLQQNLGKLQQYPQCEGYIWRFSDNQFVIDPTDQYGEIQDVCFGGNPSMPFSTTLFNTLLSFLSVPTTLCRINEPPKGRDVNVVTEEDRQTRTVTFILERDVYEGEELFIDYGLSYDRSMYGGGGGD